MNIATSFFRLDTTYIICRKCSNVALLTTKSLKGLKYYRKIDEIAAFEKAIGRPWERMSDEQLYQTLLQLPNFDAGDIIVPKLVRAMPFIPKVVCQKVTLRNIDSDTVLQPLISCWAAHIEKMIEKEYFSTKDLKMCLSDLANLSMLLKNDQVSRWIGWSTLTRWFNLAFDVLQSTKPFSYTDYYGICHAYHKMIRNSLHINADDWTQFTMRLNSTLRSACEHSLLFKHTVTNCNDPDGSIRCLRAVRYVQFGIRQPLIGNDLIRHKFFNEFKKLLLINVEDAAKLAIPNSDAFVKYFLPCVLFPIAVSWKINDRRYYESYWPDFETNFPRILVMFPSIALESLFILLKTMLEYPNDSFPFKPEMKHFFVEHYFAHLHALHPWSVAYYTQMLRQALDSGLAKSDDRNEALDLNEIRMMLNHFESFLNRTIDSNLTVGV